MEHCALMSTKGRTILMAYTPAVGRSAAVEPVSSQSRLSVSGHCGLAWAGGCCTLAVGQKESKS